MLELTLTKVFNELVQYLIEVQDKPHPGLYYIYTSLVVIYEAIGEELGELDETTLQVIKEASRAIASLQKVQQEENNETYNKLLPKQPFKN